MKSTQLIGIHLVSGCSRFGFLLTPHFCVVAMTIAQVMHIVRRFHLLVELDEFLLGVRLWVEVQLIHFLLPHIGNSLNYILQLFVLFK